MSAIALTFVASLLATFVLLAALTRLLPADFLAAAVTKRSNHRQAARQIGGLAVLPIMIGGLIVLSSTTSEPAGLLLAGAAGAALLGIVGYLDDRRELPIAIRLVCQVLAAILPALWLSPENRVLGEAVPLLAEQFLVIVGLVWFINMTNFMDGLDLMLIAGIGVPHAFLAIFGVFLLVDTEVALLAAVMAGALFGFAPYNLPPASNFMGDSGSLPIGFLTGIVVLWIATEHPVAALLPFLYFLVDSVSTLVLRLARGQDILQSHSSHAYQIARRANWSNGGIIALVGVCSAACALLAAIAMTQTQAAMLVGPAGVALLLAIGAMLLLRSRKVTSGEEPRQGL